MADYILTHKNEVYSPLLSIAEEIYKVFKCKAELEQLKGNSLVSLQSREKCPICSDPIQFSSLSTATCDKGHTLGTNNLLFLD
jgi:hypothetical protein